MPKVFLQSLRSKWLVYITPKKKVQNLVSGDRVGHEKIPEQKIIWPGKASLNKFMVSRAMCGIVLLEPHDCILTVIWVSKSHVVLYSSPVIVTVFPPVPSKK